jgi:HEAT repeat protein
MGPEARSVVSSLVSALDDSNPPVRLEAAKSLGLIGGEPANPALLRALDDSDPPVRLAAIKSLRLLAAEPKKAVPALTRIFSDTKQGRDIRGEAALTLMKYGPKAGEALLPLLKTISEETDEDTKVTVEGKEWSVRCLAMRAVEKIGGEPRQVVPHLIKVFEEGMDHQEWHQRWIPGELPSRALTYLLERAPETKEAIPMLVRLLKRFDQDVEHRILIVQALGRVGPGARDALPALRELTKSGSPQLRRAAAAVIEMIEGKTEK